MNIYELFGVHPDDAEWRDLSLCKQMGHDNFFDLYEEDKFVAQAMDEQCLDCPVIKQCFAYAKKNKQQGCWGGVYWSESGEVDELRNRHKTEDVWARLEEIHGTLRS